MLLLAVPGTSGPFVHSNKTKRRRKGRGQMITWWRSTYHSWGHCCCCCRLIVEAAAKLQPQFSEGSYGQELFSFFFFFHAKCLSFEQLFWAWPSSEKKMCSLLLRAQLCQGLMPSSHAAAGGLTLMPRPFLRSISLLVVHIFSFFLSQLLFLTRVSVIPSQSI